MGAPTSPNADAKATAEACELGGGDSWRSSGDDKTQSPVRTVSIVNGTGAASQPRLHGPAHKFYRRHTGRR